MKTSDVITDLQNYTLYRLALANTRDAIEECEREIIIVRSAINEDKPIDSSNYDNQKVISDLLKKKISLETNYDLNRRRVRRIARGLAALSDDERKVLNLFYINRPRGYVDILCEELAVERSQVYRIKNRALYKFTVSQYGSPEK